MKRLFEFEDYQSFLAATFAAEGRARGLQSRMAEHLKVRPAFLSQVIHGKTHFTLESAVLAAGFLKLNAREERFFVALVGRARSANSALTAHYSRILAELRKEDEKISRRVDAGATFTVEQELRYFSDWKNPVIQLLAVNPRFPDADSIAAAIRVDRESVADILDYLVKLGTLARTASGYTLTQKRIHIGPDSPLISRHHTNWRLQAIRSLENPTSEDLHYSSVWSLGEKDVRKIREILLEALERAEPVLRKSPDETIYSLCLDWFKVG